MNGLTVAEAARAKKLFKTPNGVRVPLSSDFNFADHGKNVFRLTDADRAYNADPKNAQTRRLPLVTDDFAGTSRGSQHHSLDLGVNTGTPVHSPKGGKVIDVGVNPTGSYGNTVVIDHGDGTYAVYAHLKEANVKRNDTVNTGDKIATSGGTGERNGVGYAPHLHFEIIKMPEGQTYRPLGAPLLLANPDHRVDPENFDWEKKEVK